MERGDVRRTIASAMKAAKLTKDNAPILLSDNGPCYIAKDLKTYLDSNFNIKQIHGKPLHPQTQGKIERYHRSMKNVVKLNHYFHPNQLIEAIEQWVEYYNNRRYHESLNNLTPADMYFGRGGKILAARKQIKRNTLIKRRQNYYNYCSVNLKSVIL